MNALLHPTDFLEWLYAATGPASALVILLSFMFREKWKQILAKAISEDLEKLKHTHQRELEAYKVSLITEAERAKTQSELKKAIALKFAEIEFESLMELLRKLENNPSLCVAIAMHLPDHKDDADIQKSNETMQELIDVIPKCKVFLDEDALRKLGAFMTTLAKMNIDHIGKNKPALELNSATYATVRDLNNEILEAIGKRIFEIGKPPL